MGLSTFHTFTPPGEEQTGPQCSGRRSVFGGLGWAPSVRAASFCPLYQETGPERVSDCSADISCLIVGCHHCSVREAARITPTTARLSCTPQTGKHLKAPADAEGKSRVWESQWEIRTWSLDAGMALASPAGKCILCDVTTVPTQGFTQCFMLMLTVLLLACLLDSICGCLSHKPCSFWANSVPLLMKAGMWDSPLWKSTNETRRCSLLSIGSR